MTALGVTGNPGDWQHAADTIGSVVARLADELAEADARGGSGLREAWYGPVADAHAGLWHRRHGHYHDLLYQAGRAAHALADFAGRLWDLQFRAANLESHWLGHGLYLNGDGTRFTFPAGWESLEHGAQVLLHAKLAESVRDIEAMWRDIEHAVGDLVTILTSVIDALADFQAIEVSVAGSMLTDYLHWKEWPHRLKELAKYAQIPLADAAYDAEMTAQRLKGVASLAASADRPAAEKAAADAAGRAKVLRYALKGDMVEGGMPGLVAANVATAAITAYDIKHGGWRKAMIKDKDAGLVAGTVADDATEGFENLVAPGFAETPVGTAISGVVGLGVGWGIQQGADYLAKHPKIVEAGVSAVKADVQGVKDVAHGVQDVAGWEARQLSHLF